MTRDRHIQEATRAESRALAEAQLWYRRAIGTSDEARTLAAVRAAEQQLEAAERRARKEWRGKP